MPLVVPEHLRVDHLSAHFNGQPLRFVRRGAHFQFNTPRIRWLVKERQRSTPSENLTRRAALDTQKDKPLNMSTIPSSMWFQPGVGLVRVESRLGWGWRLSAQK